MVGRKGEWERGRREIKRREGREKKRKKKSKLLLEVVIHFYSPTE